ncbi:hypothetical protein LU293_00725 [Moraxella nasovis]|uniref:hypothetical protein n=1 Tax=Moraxella nasovis TaxID=2904121 RepID=UPI001F6100C6|nr:hypothetical protein [Moraxella nasovis]UNU73474.1 hypothetical protein LU293_00725 [Moraxella nasovis]
MLAFSKKQAIFFECLKFKNGSYGDTIREDILYYFDNLENDTEFLNKFQSEDDIEQFTNMLVSKIILNEHQDGLDDIITYYCNY